MRTTIEMAKEAGLFTHKEVQPELERFAELVRADEREACAKLLDSRRSGANELMDATREMEAYAIRARSNT